MGKQFQIQLLTDRMSSKFCKKKNTFLKKQVRGLPWWVSGKESVCQCRGHTLDP